jgi:hypothetical protein
MSTEDKAEVFLAGSLGVLLAIATPQLPRDAKIVLWLIYLASVYGFAVVKLRRKLGGRMTFPLVLGLGILFGALAAAVAWYVFPAADGVAVASDGQHHASSDRLTGALRGLFGFESDSMTIEGLNLPSGTLAVFSIIVRNSGDPISVDLWRVDAVLADGRAVNGQLVAFEQGINVEGRKFAIEDMLTSKTKAFQPIAHGGALIGYLAAHFKDVRPNELSTAKLNIHYIDGQGTSRVVATGNSYPLEHGLQTRFPGDY